jgi:hypothetical protein
MENLSKGKTNWATVESRILYSLEPMVVVYPQFAAMG